MFSLITLLLSCVTVIAAKTVCYPHVGCFSDDPPFDNLTVLPKSPDELQIKLKLFTPTNTQPDFLDYTDSNVLKKSHFVKNLPIKIIIHGYLSHAGNNWVSDMKDAILEKEETNVIDVDWRSGALGFYNQCVANTLVVAQVLNLLLNQMVSVHGISMDNVHIIGHSLGAHIAGFVGQKQNSTIARITALDAADPGYNGRPLDARVDANDAKFVDAIHTDGGEFYYYTGLGLSTPFGHVDFFANGGVNQPGCNGIASNMYGKLKDTISGWIGKRALAETFACKHYRSHEYFIESIHSSCGFKSFPCKDYETFEKGECTSCGKNGCSELGYYADTFPGRGSLYLDTLDKKPYCGLQYKVKVSFVGSLPAYDDLDIILYGHTSVEVKITPENIKIDEEMIETVLVTEKDIFPLTSAHLILEKTSWFSSDTSALIKTFEVTDMSNGERFVSSSSSYNTVSTSSYVKITLSKVD